MNVLAIFGGRLLAAFLIFALGFPPGHVASFRHHGAVLLNDLGVTPGVVRTTQMHTATKTGICDEGGTDRFRGTTEKMKNEVYAAYGVDKHRPLPGAGSGTFKAPLYEIDHLISLELGGADDVDNLWPQPYYQHPGAREKDTVENWLHRQVCSGKMDPQEAQRSIATDWYAVYVEMNKPPAGSAQARLGPEHWQCDISNDCDLVQNKLSADGKPELTPLGCFLAKTRLTWILGDRTSMCVKKGAD